MRSPEEVHDMILLPETELAEQHESERRQRAQLAS